MTQTMTNFCYLDTNIRLSINFNDVTIWTNLIYINLSSNMITNLPRALGNLPRLQQLNLSHNCLGTCAQIKWTWIQQTAIKNTLLFLDISYNLLTELPSHIGRLNALVELNVCHNMLKCLPQTIQNMPSLEILDVSYNRLLYLEETFLDLTNLKRMNISMNAFSTQQYSLISFVEMSVIPTLIELSAKTVLEYRIPHENLTSDTLEYLDMAKRCTICQRIGITLLREKYICSAKNYTILETTKDESVIIQYYICKSCSRFIPGMLEMW